MKKKNYKTLKGLINQALYKRITFNDLKNGVFIHKNAGYMKFNLNENEMKKALLLLSVCVYDKLGNNKVYRLENYTGPRYGILNRLTIGKNLRADYCAGQDYIQEMQIIKGIFRNNK